MICSYFLNLCGKAGKITLVAGAVGLIVSAGQSVVAAPYGPQGKAISRTQPDGKAIELRVFGDEHYARTETTGGYTVVFNKATGAYHYATRSGDGNELVPTALKVGADDPASIGLQPHTDIIPAAARQLAMERRAKWETAMNTQGTWNALKVAAAASGQPVQEGGPAMAPPSFTTVGNKVGLTLLVDFADSPATISRETIDAFCNGDAFTGFGNNGSVKRYFFENSNGRLTYTNLVLRYIRVPHPKSYYDNGVTDAGVQGNRLVKDALDALKALPNYNSEIWPSLSSLTTDAFGYVTACNVFYAGEVASDWALGLWPHSSTMYSAGVQELGAGKIVNKYQITDIGNMLELGTFCHENGHMLCGYPDIYDYEYDSVGGAGGFCLMNSGGHGTNPVNVCAYLKYAAGWATVTNFTPQTRTVAAFHSTFGQAGYNNFFRMVRPNSNNKEYYLIENRNQSGRDAGLAASGIAIWHIDELGDKNNQSLTPNTLHLNYECTLVQADGRWDFQNDANSGDAGDLFFGARTFNDTTTPSSRWWSGDVSGIDIRSFGAAGTEMNVQFGQGMDPNTIDLTSPNGGEERYWGSTYSITWNTNVPGDARIELLKGGTAVAVLTENTPNNGEFVWVPAADLVPGGDYRIRITSIQDPGRGDTSAGTFSVLAAGPTITSPLVVQGAVGIPFSYQITANNMGANFVASGLPQGLSSDSNGLISGTPSVSGTFYVTLYASNVIGTTSSTLRIMIDSVNGTLIDALDSPALEWTSGGATGWAVQAPPGSTHDGVDSAQSRALGNDESNWIETRVTGPGVLSFWWAVSSESYDKLRFSMDGLEVATGDNAVPPIFGTVGWVKQTKNIPAGIHVLRWTYAKDHTASSGMDTAWVDQVSFAAIIPTPEINVGTVTNTVLTPLGDGTSSVAFGDVIFGSSATREFKITNTGSGALHLGAISFTGTQAAAYSVSTPPAVAEINPGESATFTVRLLPSSAGPQPATMHIASDDADENPFDVNLNGLVAPKQEYPGALIKVPATGSTSGAANPRPSTVTVSGVSGTVLAVKLKLNGFFHADCDDIDMYLKSPGGKFCTIMSDAGQGSISSSAPRNLVFEDAASGKIPDVGIPSGTSNFKPADYLNGGGSSNPALYDTASRPGGTEVFTLNALAADGVNGIWELYVYDDTESSRGDITSWALVIETANPDISVEHPAGTVLVDGASSINFGAVSYGSSTASLAVTVKNTGNASLTGLSVTKSGPAQGDFTVGALPVSTLAAGASTTFNITFTPGTLGLRSAAIQISSNDADESPFDIGLTGNGIGTPSEIWRWNHFGSPDNSGSAADLSDPDADGIPNLVEYAFDLDPTENSAGRLPVPAVSGGDFVVSFVQPPTVGGVTYGAEWSTSLGSGTWTPIPDTGANTAHVFSVPRTGKAKCFIRIRVTRP